MTAPADPAGRVQYRLVLGKRVPDLVDGPDDADVVVSVPRDDALGDPTVLYMQGRLKAVGHTGVLLDALASGRAAAALAALAASPPDPAGG